MKVYLEASHFAADKSRQRLKLEQVQYLLERHQNIQQRRFLKELANIIIYSDFFFSALPASLIAELVIECFGFLETKKDTIALKTLTLPDDKQSLLIISGPNTPYLIESLLLLQSRYHSAFNLLAYPVLSIIRRESGIIGLSSDAEPGDSELLIFIKLDNVDGPSSQRIQQQAKLLLEQSCRVVQSQALFADKLQHLKDLASLHEYRALLAWLQHDAFIPIFYKQFKSDAEAWNASAYQGADLLLCLDIFNHEDKAQLQQEVTRLLSRPNAGAVHKLAVRSVLVGHDALVYAGFRENQDQGWIEHGFIGVFKNIEINCAACHVGELRDKIESTVTKIRISKDSHGFIKLQQLFNLFPKLELFFLGESQLDLLAHSLCHYLSRPHALKLLFLASPSPLCISLLVIIPKTFQSAALEKTLTKTLCAELPGEVRSQRLIDYGESFSALHLLLLPEQECLHIDVVRLEKRLNRQCRPWLVHFRLLLDRTFGKQQAGRYWQKYQHSFGSDYQSTLPPRYALKDLLQCEELERGGRPSINLFAPCQGQEHFRLHFYSLEEQFLDEYIPVLGALNLRLVDQVQFTIMLGSQTLFIKSFSVQSAAGTCRPLYRLKSALLAMITAIMRKRVDNDELNRLLLLTGMSWQEIDVLRLYRNYCMQLNFHVTIASFHRALLNNPPLARSLYDYFEVRFRPAPEWEDAMLREEQGLFPIRLRLLQDIESVSDLNDDRILRTLFNLIDSTVRSNFHVRRNLDDYLIAIKINSLGVLDMPSPRPSYEIYVHAADMEGIHLRGGKIARGGIRWSDRPDDFRTEILGLMQTQMSKNALIVPTGAKGGFVVTKQRRGEEFRQAGKRAYQQLMRALLDLTDNYIDEQVNTLPGIVRYDAPDPYLVVAADKGTAQFPDVANAVAAEYRFWLGDAFASGGSKGYNHKSMGITARGAWESVKRHFRELDKDIQTQTFNVVGVGSMDGDVFGNGMLLSRCILLRAAISGLHIFIDPAPDPEVAYRERRRLFELPGSSWEDYQAELISEGGGVYRRDSKDIPVTKAVREWLGIRYKTLDGETLIRHLLTAPADLLWLGGIGTYVKASDQKHEEVGDRQNDTVRVDACDLKVRVVGEGANLGFTRQARIEFALSGGLINTDAIDNSAGVDTSDHEVNLKILLRELHRQGKVDDYQTLFDRLAESVAESVLADNYAQTLCLSLEQLRCNKQPEVYLELADRLSAAGLLDFVVESFPSTKTVMARDKIKLTRPELAVLMASAKRWLTQQLLEMPEFVSASCCDVYLLRYFPDSLVQRHGDSIAAHPLATAIKATCISNLLVNQAGCSLIAMAIELSTTEVAGLVSSYLAFDRILHGDQFRNSVFALDNRIDAAAQYRLLLEFETRLSDFTRWCVANNARLKPEIRLIDEYRGYLERFIAQAQTRVETRVYGDEEPLPEALLQRLHFLASINDFPAIVKLAIDSHCEIEKIIELYHQTAELLALDSIRIQLDAIALQDAWERKMFTELRAGIARAQSRLVGLIVDSGCQTVRRYFSEESRQVCFQRYQHACQDLSASVHHRLMPYLVWHQELEALLRATIQEHRHGRAE